MSMAAVVPESFLLGAMVMRLIKGNRGLARWDLGNDLVAIRKVLRWVRLSM